MGEIPVRAFRRILRNFERELNVQNQSGCCCGITITQCHTLMELDIEDNITLNELAARIHLDKSTVSRTVESLVNKGLIERTIPKSNRRTTLITLTMEGKEVCNSINSGNDIYFGEVLFALPVDLRSAFYEGFEAVVNAMTKLNASTRS
nr:MarR family transcriptional regulator [Bacteroidota bacterium]